MHFRGASLRRHIKKRILALGPVSENHGEAKMFNHSCRCLKDKFYLNIIDSVKYEHRFIRLFVNPICCAFLLIIHRPTHFYLSYSRNKFMLLSLFLVVTPIIKLFNIKCIYHIHDTSLKKELSGTIGEIVRFFYLKCVSLTVIPNKTLLFYSLVHPNMSVKFLLNPFIGAVQHNVVERKNSYCFISVPSRNKNLDIAINLIQSQGKRLEVIGWSEADLRTLYPDLRVDLNKITFCGYMAHDNAMELLSGSLGLISVSDREAMPLSIIEALMRRVPVYVANHTGYRYFINNFESVQNIQELTEANTHVDERAVTLSCEKAKKLFSICRYKSEFIQLFE